MGAHARTRPTDNIATPPSVDVTSSRTSLKPVHGRVKDTFDYEYDNVVKRNRTGAHLANCVRPVKSDRGP